MATGRLSCEKRARVDAAEAQKRRNGPGRESGAPRIFEGHFAETA
jgi:hypothetical protein